jgi:hypothetical protein
MRESASWVSARGGRNGEIEHCCCCCCCGGGGGGGGGRGDGRSRGIRKRVELQGQEMGDKEFSCSRILEMLFYPITSSPLTDCCFVMR